MTTSHDQAATDQAEVADRYRRFAVEARDRSHVYRCWAEAVSASAGACAVLARVPAAKRQPPLVFAVARMLGAPASAGLRIDEWIVERSQAFVDELGSRSVQTNDPQRCALLLPELLRLDGPVALLEIGASAGLCLFPDRYAYRYSGARQRRWGSGRPELTCVVEGEQAVPFDRSLEVVWRAGLDLEPLDAADPDDRAFLVGLAWPGEQGRAERIAAAAQIAAADPPLMIAGDATDPDEVRALAARAPASARLVVTTPGVLPHLSLAGRRRLVETIGELAATWISVDRGIERAEPGFVLRVDGEVIADCDPLGGWLTWR